MLFLLQRGKTAMTEPCERSWSFCQGGTCVTSILCWFRFLRANSRTRIPAYVPSLGGAGNTSREVGKWKGSQETVGYPARYHSGQLQFNPVGKFEETGQLTCPVILWRKEWASICAHPDLPVIGRGLLLGGANSLAPLACVGAQKPSSF